MTQEQLALEADVQRNYISLLERGQNSPSVRMVFKLCAALGAEPSALMKETEAEVGLEHARRRIAQKQIGLAEIAATMASLLCPVCCLIFKLPTSR